MKALILAAGYGTRLRPYTNFTPKPLFTIAGQPILDILINRLQKAGCTDIMINTHHLHQKIETFIAGQNYAPSVHLRYEPRILGTGGAIKNGSDFWDDRPFFVINGDIITDIDLKTVYDTHCGHDHPATLVLYDDPQFNTVTVDPDDFITDFKRSATPSLNKDDRQLTFTGIQVIDPDVMMLIPAKKFASSIDAYALLLKNGKKIKAVIPDKVFWDDIGTPRRYQKRAIQSTIPYAFQQAFPQYKARRISQVKLKGDGSERQWYRLSASNQLTLIMADHGIRTRAGICEIDAFIHIGRHLRQKEIPVPEIYYDEPFAGLVFLEDLGDTHLQTLVKQAESAGQIAGWYQTVIDHLVTLSIRGAQGFDQSWAYQSPAYDKHLILEKECRYFVEAFLNGFLKEEVNFENFQSEFTSLAEETVANAVTGFMHRDLQSRNIMVKDSQFYFIDFQGGRIGPLQYDLASLLLDPYVNLPYSLQENLVDVCFAKIASALSVDPEIFYRGYRCCSLTRNLQILGAFGYLSIAKGKSEFQAYIPSALETLRFNLDAYGRQKYPDLTKTIKMISDHPKIKLLQSRYPATREV